MQESTVKVGLYLDTRRKRNDGSYPIKLYVYNGSGKAKNYGTNLVESGSIRSLTKEEFKSAWETTKTRETFKPLKESLQKLINHAEDLVESIDPFSFEEFESKLLRKSTDGANVFWHYKERINHFKSLDSIGTAVWYLNSMDSIKGYLKTLNVRSADSLRFEEITPKWILRYEKYMLDIGRSKVTISMYLRALRAIFNQAIQKGDVDRSIYPFTKGGYEIKGGRKVKKALSNDELKLLFQAEPMSPEQHKAKDFWFFSYFCNGMNIKDILYLRYGQIGKDSFTFERIKTKNTDRESEQIEVILNEYTRMVISEYGTTPAGSPKQLVFPFISESEPATVQHTKTKSFTRFINQHIKKLAVNNGLTKEISTYFARHSFATGLIRGGKSIAFVQESLGHASSKTTQGYISGFLNEDRKEAAESLYLNLMS